MSAPDGPQTTKFSRRHIHSSVRSACRVGAGTEEAFAAQATKLLLVRKLAALRLVCSGALPTGELLTEEARQHRGRFPALCLGRRQHLGATRRMCGSRKRRSSVSRSSGSAGGEGVLIGLSPSRSRTAGSTGRRPGVR